MKYLKIGPKIPKLAAFPALGAGPGNRGTGPMLASDRFVALPPGADR